MEDPLDFDHLTLMERIKKTRIKAKTGGLYNKKEEEMPVEEELRVVFFVEPLKHIKTVFFRV